MVVYGCWQLVARSFVGTFPFVSMLDAFGHNVATLLSSHAVIWLVEFAGLVVVTNRRLRYLAVGVAVL